MMLLVIPLSEHWSRETCLKRLGTCRVWLSCWDLSVISRVQMVFWPMQIFTLVTFEHSPCYSHPHLLPYFGWFFQRGYKIDTHMISILRGSGNISEKLNNLSVNLVSGQGKIYTPQIPQVCSVWYYLLTVSNFLRSLEIFVWNPN